MASELSILIVGDGGGAAQLLPAPQSPSLKCRHVSDVEAALRSVDDDRFDLIVLALRRRGEFTAFDATRLEARMPLARVIAVAGPWCEGPRRRNVDHLVGAEVVPWHRWPGWLHANIRQYERSQPAQWSLPAPRPFWASPLRSPNSWDNWKNCCRRGTTLPGKTPLKLQPRAPGLPLERRGAALPKRLQIFRGVSVSVF